MRLNRYVTITRLPKDLKQTFIRNLYATDFARCRIFAAILIPVFILNVIADLSNKDKGLWSNPGYYDLFIIHCATLAAMVFFALVFFLSRPKSEAGINIFHKIAVNGICLALMLSAVATAAADQKIHGQITAYVIFSFGISASILFSHSASIVIHGIALALFLIGISYTQTDYNQLYGHYANGTTLTLISWVLTRIMYSGFKKNFLQNITIDDQRHTISVKTLLNDVIFDAIPVGLLRLMPDGSIQQHNKKLLEILNLAEPLKNLKEVVERGWKILRQDGSVMPASEYLLVDTLSEMKRIDNRDIGIITPGSEPVWINLNVSPVSPEAGGGAMAVLIDVTEKRLTGEMLGAVHRQSPVAILIIDANETPPRLLSINPAVKTMFGVDHEDEFLSDLPSLLPEIQHNGAASVIFRLNESTKH